MPTMPPAFRANGVRTRQETNQEADARRGSATSRGYTHRWSKARATWLKRHPLCGYCQLEGRVVAADLVDHLYPHRTFPDVFWLTAFWVSCCTSCHNTFKQAIERAGRLALDALAARLGLPSLSDYQGRGGSKSLEPFHS
jgi:5-methylcytosine-specific restriction protein A